MELYDSIVNVKNIGEKRRELLNKVGIYTIKDLIEYIPRDYADRSIIMPLCNVSAGNEYTVKCKIVRRVEVLLKGKIKIVKTAISDQTAVAEVVWFNMVYLRNTLDPKKEYYFTGTFQNKYGKLTLTSPDFEEVREQAALNSGRIVPVYHLTKNLNQKLLRRLIYDALNELTPYIKEFLPKNVLKEYGLPQRADALKSIHFPTGNDAFISARHRLVFEELLVMQLRLFNVKGQIKRKKCGFTFSFFETDRIINALPFKLTMGQTQVLDEIIEDMSTNHPMNRLLQGDVGSGKTAVAMVCAYIAYINGTQTAVMAPTDVLATQHYDSFSKIFSKMGIRVVLLKGSLSPKQKKEVRSQISSGEAHIVVGTHALIQESVEFKEPGLVITDEHHRFGVNQRKIFEEKGKNPHVLVMTATPAPRTLGLILYGDLDISTIKTMPEGRQKIDTCFVDSSYRERIYNFILKNVRLGRQAYIVCPMIDENDKNELKSIKEYVKVLEGTCLQELNIGIVHGKMKPMDKQFVMDSFAAGSIDVLVATTVIEVGINVPNAAIMLIENAERYGLSQLHQLRGRVGRGEFKSYCILVSDKKNEEVKKRLKTMVNSSDGFKLSEQDLALRGPGDFFGTRQHGLPEFKIANLYRDTDILKEAQKCALNIYERDPLLESEENKALANRIEEIFDFENDGVTM